MKGNFKDLFNYFFVITACPIQFPLKLLNLEGIVFYCYQLINRLHCISELIKINMLFLCVNTSPLLKVDK